MLAQSCRCASRGAAWTSPPASGWCEMIDSDRHIEVTRAGNAFLYTTEQNIQAQKFLRDLKQLQRHQKVMSFSELVQGYMKR